MSVMAVSQPGRVRRILGSPPARVLVLGFVLGVMLSLNTAAMTSYAAEPVEAILHIVALAIAGVAVYVGHACFIELRTALELALPGMVRESGLGLLIGAGLYAAFVLILTQAP
jgi:uncharacterized protein